VRSLMLLTNNPTQSVGLDGCAPEDRIEVFPAAPVTPRNLRYLRSRPGTSHDAHGPAACRAELLDAGVRT